LFLGALFGAIPSVAQSPNYDNGPIRRVVYYRIKPGQGEPLWRDFREHLKPSYEAPASVRLKDKPPKPQAAFLRGFIFLIEL
jgi:hypothetical protein